MLALPRQQSPAVHLRNPKLVDGRPVFHAFVSINR